MLDGGSGGQSLSVTHRSVEATPAAAITETVEIKGLGLWLRGALGELRLRTGKLHLTAYMRGNDAVRGTLCDVFSFTVLHELMARTPGVELGTYCHVVGSMHVNDSAEWDCCEGIVRAP